MPEIAFMTVEDIDGESNVKKQENKIEVLAFEHEVVKPVDVNDAGKVRGGRQHKSVVVTKRLDKASPLLAQKLVESGTIGEIKIEWYRQPPKGSGDPEHYYTITFKNCIITRIRPWMPNVMDPRMNTYGHMEDISFGYQQITWTSETDGKEFTDDFRNLE